MNQSGRPWLRPVLIVVVIVIVAIAALGLYGREPERRLYALNATDGKVAWSAPIDLAWNNYARIATDQGHVFISTDDSRDHPGSDQWRMDAYDSATGQHDWTYAPFGAQGADELCLSMTSNGPIASGGQVYTWVCAGAEGDGSDTFEKASIVALDGASGKVLWEHDAPEMPRVMALGAPLPLRVIDGSAYVLTSNEQSQWALNVLDSKSGQTQRQIPLPDLAGHDPTDLPTSAIQVDTQTIYLNVDTLSAIKPADGKVLFALEVGQTPWYAGREGIYGNVRADGMEKLTAFSPVDGGILWQKVFDKTALPDQAADGDIDLSMQMNADNANVYVYATDRRNHQIWMVAVRQRDGAIAWTKPLEDQGLFSDILMRPSGNGRVVAYVDGNGIHAADTTSGALLWSFRAEFNDTSPVVDDQYVYFFDQSPRYRNWLASINPAWH